MNRRIVFNLCAALLMTAQISVAEESESKAQAPVRLPLLDETTIGKALEDTINHIFKRNSDAIVRVESTDELGKLAGTGFFMDEDGLIYTLSAVVGDGLDLTVTYQNKKLPAKLLAKDPKSGVALVKIDNVKTPFLMKADETEVKPAMPLLVIGYPFDHEISPSFGIVGGLDKKSKGRYFATTHIRANIPVQRGQGGSPVMNLHGQVVGILVSGFEEGSGCYALPIRAAEKAHRDYSRFGEVRHGWAGVTVQQIPESVDGSTLAIDIVDPSGPAASVFRSGDVILKVGDTVIRRPEDAIDAAFYLTEGEPISVEVSRNGERLTLPITPATHPMERSHRAIGASANFGMDAHEVTP